MYSHRSWPGIPYNSMSKISKIPLPKGMTRSTRKEVVIIPPPSRSSSKTRGKKTRAPRRQSRGTLQTGRQTWRAPGFFPTGGSTYASKQGITVVEEEYIGEVNGTTGFFATAYAFNPGQSTTFPWLSQQAAQWEKYMVRNVEFIYRPEVSGFATNGQTGKVILSFDYDAADPPPTAKRQVEDTQPNASCMPYEEIRLKLDPRQLNGQDSKYVRPGGLPGQSDIKTYDGGNLYVSTYGNTNTNVLGELFVKYSITFMVPILDATNSAPTNNSVSTFESTTAETIATTATPQVLLLATSRTNGLGAVNTAGSIVLKPGNYLVDVSGWFTNPATISPFSITLQKNGISVWTTYVPTGQATATAGLVDQTLTGPAYVSCNGTDYIQLVASVTFAAASPSCAGFMRIVAI